MREQTGISSEANHKGLITVVIPAFRARRFLPEALASVWAQTYPTWEIVVVDDCSPEPVEDLVNAFAATAPKNSVRLLRHPENKGLGATRNTGIRAANGEFVAFLDHDDVWRPSHLQDATAALESEQAELAYCDFEVFHEKPGDLPQSAGDPVESWGEFPASLYVHNFIAPSGVVMRKRSLEELDLFRELRAAEDLDLWLRAAGRGVKFARVTKANLLYRKHGGAMTGSLRAISEAKAEVLCRNVGTVLQVPLAFRRRQESIVCGEAARACQEDDLERTAYFYGLSFRTNPKQLKHLCAWLYYRAVSMTRKFSGHGR